MWDFLVSPCDTDFCVCKHFGASWVLFHGNGVYLQLSALVLWHLIPSYNPYMHILPCFKFQPVESIFSHHTTTLLSLFNLKMGKSKWRKERKHLGQIKAENLAILKLYQNGSRVFENKLFFFPLQTMTDSLKMFLETSLIHPHPFGKIVLVTLICGNLGSLSTDRIEYSFL